MASGSTAQTLGTRLGLTRPQGETREGRCRRCRSGRRSQSRPATDPSAADDTKPMAKSLAMTMLPCPTFRKLKAGPTGGFRPASSLTSWQNTQMQSAVLCGEAGNTGSFFCRAAQASFGIQCVQVGSCSNVPATTQSGPPKSYVSSCIGTGSLKPVRSHAAEPGWEEASLRLGSKSKQHVSCLRPSVASTCSAWKGICPGATPSGRKFWPAVCRQATRQALNGRAVQQWMRCTRMSWSLQRS